MSEHHKRDRIGAKAIAAECGRAVVATSAFAAVVDIVLLGRSGALSASGAALCCALWCAVAAPVWIVLFGIRFSQSLGPLGAERPDNPATLLFAGTAGYLWSKFAGSVVSGAGIRRMGIESLVAGGTTFFVVVGVFLLLWAPAFVRAKRPVVRGFFFLGIATVAIVAAYFERTHFRGQYLFLHRVTAVGAICALSSAALAVGRRPPPPLKAVGIVAAVVLAAGAGGGAFIARNADSPIVFGLAARPEVGASRWIEMIAALAVTEAHESPEIDEAYAVEFLKPAAVDIAELLRRRDRLLSDRPTDFILISIDTVRADRVGHLGYKKNPTTPQWDRAASTGISFESAYTPYPTSNLAYSSLFTSRRADECPQYLASSGGSDDRTIAEILRDRGYRTIAITAFEPPHLGPKAAFSTFKTGFTEFQTNGAEKGPSDAQKIADRVIEALEREPSDGPPIFMWVQIFDPHAEYVSWPNFFFGHDKASRYDSELANADAALGRILAAVSGRRPRKAFVAVHSDHGEAFGDHGFDYHNSSLYDEQIRVPWTLHHPDLSPMRIRETVSLVDLLPTMLTLLGVDDPQKERRAGRDLAPLILGLRAEEKDGGYAGAMLLLEYFTAGKKTALVKGKKKFIRTPSGLPPREAYDLERDPTESRNIVGDDPQADARGFGVLEILFGERKTR